MSYDPQLAMRVRALVGKHRGVAEKKMFGGVAFLLHGRMFCGVLKHDLVVRVGPAKYNQALAKAHTRPMDFTGKPMIGYVYVAPGGCADGKSLRQWVGWGLEFVSSLPPEKRQKRPSRRKKP